MGRVGVRRLLPGGSEKRWLPIWVKGLVTSSSGFETSVGIGGKAGGKLRDWEAG